mgnify:CR=1 FL=1|tara:strand:+ start:339 stop:518 length:180 start_codon:yes stop_codon:yes gene_type:complete
MGLLNKIFKFDMSGRYTRYEMYELYLSNYKFWNLWRDAAKKIILDELINGKDFRRCKNG